MSVNEFKCNESVEQMNKPVSSEASSITYQRAR
jgi:hypothetical protein